MAKGYGRMGGGHMGGMGNMRSQFQDLQRQMAEQQEKIAAMEKNILKLALVNAAQIICDEAYKLIK